MKTALNITFLFILSLKTAFIYGQNIKSESAFDDGNIFFHNAIAYCKYNMTENNYCKESAEFFDEALKYYQVAYKTNKNNAELNFKMGICYYAKGQTDLAVPYMESALSINPEIDPQADFYMALAYKHNYQWINAIEYFQSFNDKCKSEKISSKNRIDEKILLRHIEQCNLADSLSTVNVSYSINNMGSQINSRNNDYSPVLSETGLTLLFTSSQLDMRLKPDDVDSIDFMMQEDAYIDNIYVSYKKEGVWNKSKRIEDFLTVVGEHYAILDLAPNSDKCLIYHSLQGGDIYEGNFKNGDWDGMHKLEGLNSGQFEPTAVYSPDMQSIYLVSNRMGGSGGKDIYISHRDSIGKYSKPVNLGTIINTDKDEDGVFLLNDTTMYFGSKGHTGLGGFDIYKSIKRNGEWTAPVNVGFPINTPYNDLFFSITHDKAFAYVASDRHGSEGKLDIFEISYDQPQFEDKDTTNDEIPKIASPKVPVASDTSTILNGMVSEFETNVGLSATIKLYNADHELLQELQSNNAGNYKLQVNKHELYFIKIEANNYSYFWDSLKLDIIPYEFVYRSKLLKQKSMSVTQLVISNAESANSNSVIVEGQLIDQETLSYIENATIKVIDTETDKVVKEEKVTGGRYRLELPAGKTYKVIAEADGYIYQSQTIALAKGQKAVSQTDCMYKKNLLGNPDIDKNKTYQGNVMYLGDVVAFNTQNNVKAKIEFYDIETDSLIYSVKTDDMGKFKLLLESDKYYKVKVKAEGYLEQVGYINSAASTDVVYSKMQALKLEDAMLKNNVDELLVTRDLHQYTSLNINLYDQSTNQKIQGNIKIQQPETGYEISTPNSSTNIITPVLKGQRHILSFSAPGYVAKAESVIIPDTLAPFELNVYLAPESVKESKLNFPNILFSSARFDVRSDFAKDLAKFAEEISQLPDTKIVLSGHADSRGNENANLRLSKKRAEAVARFLERKGIKQDRIEILAFGEEKPVASNDTEEGQAQNRRVEFEVKIGK